MNSWRFVAFCCALLVPSAAHAGGWTQDEGAMYGKIWGTGIFGNAGFDVDGEVVDTESFSLVSLSAYGEYGLRRDLTLVGAIEPVGAATFADQTRGYSGRMLVGLRQRFASDPVQFAVEARLGGSPGFGGERDLAGADLDLEFRPTVRTYSAEWELQLGIPISDVGWVTAALGPRWSSNSELDPALQGAAQVGFGPFAGFVFDVHLSLNHSFRAPEVLNVAGATNTRYLGVGLGVSYWFVPSFAIRLAGDGVFYAQSNAAAPALQLGVELRR